MLKNKNILIGISGGISAYKICSLIRMYKSAGANVRVVVTPNALEFVTKLTLQTLSGNEVFVNNFQIDEYKPEHISLIESDIFVIAPASANTISKIANGICDNLLLTTACAFKNPILIVPAMNTNMWENVFIQENMQKLKNSGFHILQPSEGFLACGTNGIGRMREVNEIYDKTVELLKAKNKILKDKKILITAGGTREKLDPVRYITNMSSGKMGIALAEAANNLGAEVTLVSTFEVHGNYKNIVTPSAGEMAKAVKENLFEFDAIIMAAAVADYRAAEYSEQKIKKTSAEKITIELVKNPDILKEICYMKNNDTEHGKKPLIIGFCAESENLTENAKLKINNKKCDYIIANDISRKDIGFNSDENEVYLINKNLETKKLKKDTKQNISKQILEEIFG